ncbi:MAG: hypothetical protein ABI605_13830 [Rhizobacter sp.]
MQVIDKKQLEKVAGASFWGWVIDPIGQAIAKATGTSSPTDLLVSGVTGRTPTFTGGRKKP